MDAQANRIAQVSGKRDFGYKVYLVWAPVSDFAEGEPNVRVVAAKLTLASAHSVAIKHRGSSIERLTADKVIEK